MQSIAYIPASNGTGNASQMTVQTLRSPGASDILVNTVTGVPTKFYGSMGAPHTFTDPVTGETITIISEATAVDFAGHIDTGKIVIDAIAPGYVDTRGSLVGDIVVVRPVTEWANNIFNVLNQSLNDNGTIKNTAITYQPTVFDHVASGAVLAGLGYGATLTVSLSAGTCYINGVLQTIAAVASRTYTASKDTYVDALYNANGTATIVYTEVANNAASPALAANSIRLGIVISGANILNVGSINQGQENKLLPIVSSVPYQVTDSLGNLICPRDPQRKLLGYRQSNSVFTGSSATLQDITGMLVPAIIPDGRKVKISFVSPHIYMSVDSTRLDTLIAEDGATIQRTYVRNWVSGSGGGGNFITEKVKTPTAGLHTYKVQVGVGVGGGVPTVYGDADTSYALKIELE